MDYQNAWSAAVGQLQMDMSLASFDTWVKPAELVGYKDGQFTIGVPNAYACDWLKSRLTTTVIRILTGLMETPQEVEFIVWHKDYQEPPQREIGMDSLLLN
jgi:chromosomal replication initiator protein